MIESQYSENVMPQMWQVLSAIQPMEWTGRLKLMVTLSVCVGSAERDRERGQFDLRGKQDLLPKFESFGSRHTFES